MPRLRCGGPCSAARPTSDEDVLDILGDPPPAPAVEVPQASAAVTQAAPPVSRDQPLVLRGRQGKSVIVKGGIVTLTKEKSLLSSQRERTLPRRNISSVEVKKPGAMWAGFIQFSIAGGAVRNASFTWSGGSADAAADENSVLFNDQASYSIAQRIKEYVENYREPAPTTTPSNVSAADEIMKLKGLLDQGIILATEFEAKKRQLLGI